MKLSQLQSGMHALYHPNNSEESVEVTVERIGRGNVRVRILEDDTSVSVPVQQHPMFGPFVPGLSQMKQLVQRHSGGLEGLIAHRAIFG